MTAARSERGADHLGGLSLAVSVAACALMLLVGCDEAVVQEQEATRVQLVRLRARLARLEAEIDRQAKKLEELCTKAALPVPGTTADVSVGRPAALVEPGPDEGELTAPAPGPEEAEAAVQRASGIPFDEFARKVQIALKRAGFDPGPIDGKKGRMTTTAIKAFQKENKLPETGMADEATWVLLKRYLE